MDKSTLTANLGSPVSRLELIRESCRGKTVLDIGCVQHRAYQADDPQWLHRAIVDVAAKVVGVDYLPDEVAELNRRGYNVICADVTKPLPVDGTFDVIVVGNLIEHLSSFEGLLVNIRKLLNPGGFALISTANPFYREQYFFSAYRNDIIVNEEHTCWIDPATLDQLCSRFGLMTERVHWVKGGWKLGQVILHGDKRVFDAVLGKWHFKAPASWLESVIAPCLLASFKALMPTTRVSAFQKKHAGDTPRVLYLKFVELVFNLFWATYSTIIVTSRINKHELFVSVLRPARQ